MRESEPHFEEKMPIESQEKSEKEIAWEKQMEEVEKIPNLEDGIKKIIVALNISEIPTSQSCEGHIIYQKNETGIVLPCVEISTPDQPEKRFIGQEKTIKRVANKYDVPAENVKTMILHNALWKEFEDLKETQNYKKWREKNKKIAEKAETLLKDFYQDSTTPEHIRLVIHEQEAGRFDVYNLGGSQGYQPVGEKDLTPRQKAELDEQLLQYQKEMDNFAEFLREKYFRR